MCIVSVTIQLIIHSISHRYFGKPEFSSKGSWCGVELDEPKGKNNGSVQGIRYFSCPHECGIFVPSSKVELDPIGESRVRARTSVTSLVEKRARKMGTNNNRKTSPFFYNTMPYRSLSIPALDQAFSLPADKCEDKRTTFNDKSKQSPLHGPRTNHISPLKKYTSEMNLKIEKTNKVLNQQLSPSNRHIMSRRPLGSFSEMPPFGKSLRNSISCNDLSLGCPPKASIKKFSLQVSPAPIDTDDGLSCYSSTSDLSHGESDTDITPHSSSTSPCFIDFETTDTKLALKPPNRVPLPTGLATPTTTLIESSRNNKECKITSPDHQKPSKIYQNGRTITPTLEHPLVNGLAYDKDAQDNKENNSNNKKVFICPNSGQQIVAPVSNSISHTVR